MNPVRVFITGMSGMLGRTLAQSLEGIILVNNTNRVDILDLSELESSIRDTHPDALIHCAAKTAVDQCESDIDGAFRTNAIGTKNVAIACHRNGVRLISISTDYVFDGRLSRPYHEFDQVGPATVYGASKLAGENAIRQHCPDHVIARVAWLYGAGGPSFVHTMLKLGQETGETLRVVDDQIGNPTSCMAVTRAVHNLLLARVCGTFHVTCEGEATWFGLAAEIFSRIKSRRQLVRCSTAEFPRPAIRPANSRLEKRAFMLSGLPMMPHWREALSEFLGTEKSS